MHKLSQYRLPFNKPALVGNELAYIADAVHSGKISGNGDFTRKCQSFFETRYGFHKTLMTSSCTDALEMISILADLKPGDEVIIPSYTFVSTANAFILRGARIRFADSSPNNPNIDPTHIEHLINSRTRVLVVVHYAGISCKMDQIREVAQRHNLLLVEDAAHSIDSYFCQEPLGRLGALSAFSFHETKNVISGEGGLVVINDPALVERAEIIWEKGTNRSAFSRGEVSKYHWVDIGSSFLPSEIVTAFLYAQLEKLEVIQKTRVSHWRRYMELLGPLEQLGYLALPEVPHYATINGHLFYIVCANSAERDSLCEFLSRKSILAVFHYLPLHESPFYRERFPKVELPNASKFGDCLLRLPLYLDLTDNDVRFVASAVSEFYLGSQSENALVS